MMSPLQFANLMVYLSLLCTVLVQIALCGNPRVIWMTALGIITLTLVNFLMPDAVVAPALGAAFTAYINWVSRSESGPDAGEKDMYTNYSSPGKKVKHFRLLRFADRSVWTVPDQIDLDDGSTISRIDQVKTADAMGTYTDPTTSAEERLVEFIDKQRAGQRKAPVLDLPSREEVIKEVIHRLQVLRGRQILRYRDVFVAAEVVGLNDPARRVTPTRSQLGKRLRRSASAITKTIHKVSDAYDQVFGIGGEPLDDLTAFARDLLPDRCVVDVLAVIIVVLAVIEDDTPGA